MRLPRAVALAAVFVASGCSNSDDLRPMNGGTGAAAGSSGAAAASGGARSSGGGVGTGGASGGATASGGSAGTREPSGGAKSSGGSAGTGDAPDGGTASGGSADAGGTNGTSDASAASGGAAGACGEHLKYGANIHNGSKTDPALVASTLSSRNLTSARMDLYALDASYLAQFRAQVAALSSKGVAVEAVVFDDYSRGNSASANCAADLGTVEQHAYDQTLASVQKTIDIVLDYELQNEISLYENIKKANSTGQTADDYDVQCALFQAANLRGMSRAVGDLKKSTGRPLRIILGTTDRSFGFLSFMGAHGVTFDVVGYHIYPAINHPPLDQDPWFGTGGPLGQLAKFNRPIRINEFNCSEIYQDGYENMAGATVTETCLKSVAKHLLEVARQTVANVESVSFYELVDEPSNAPPENRFGLMYDLNRPKTSLYLGSAFAGGALSKTERDELTNRGLLTDEQITAFQPCGAR